MGANGSSPTWKRQDVVLKLQTTAHAVNVKIKGCCECLSSSALKVLFIKTWRLYNCLPQCWVPGGLHSRQDLIHIHPCLQAQGWNVDIKESAAIADGHNADFDPWLPPQHGTKVQQGARILQTKGTCSLSQQLTYQICIMEASARLQGNFMSASGQSWRCRWRIVTEQAFAQVFRSLQCAATLVRSLLTRGSVDTGMLGLDPARLVCIAPLPLFLPPLPSLLFTFLASSLAGCRLLPPLASLLPKHKSRLYPNGHFVSSNIIVTRLEPLGIRQGASLTNSYEIKSAWMEHTRMSQKVSSKQVFYIPFNLPGPPKGESRYLVHTFCGSTSKPRFGSA